MEGTCSLRAQAGETPQQYACHGLPVATALARVGVGSFGYLTVPRTDGTVAYLPARDVEEPTTVFEGDVPPLLFVDEPATRFYRPPKIDDPLDVNARDNVTTPSWEALTIGVHGGRVVEVQATASTTSTTAGSPVRFTAAVVGGGAFEFAWTFGDGATATGESVSHEFAGSGTYLARVTATGIADESGGESGPVEVVVGNPPTTATPGATTTPPQPTAPRPTGAPGKGHGGRGGSGSKPGSGGKGKNPSRGSSAQRGTSPAGRSSSGSSAEPSSPEPIPGTTPEPTPESPTAMPSRAPAGSSVGTSPEPPGCCSGEVPTEDPDRQAQAPSRGELVEGRLVGEDLGPVPVADAPAGPAPGQGSRSAPGAVDKGGAGAPVVALMVVALLAGGALLEWRRSRPIR